MTSKQSSNLMIRILQYQSNIVGEGFEQETKPNHAVINIIGEISKAMEFNCQNLFIVWEFYYDKMWMLDDDYQKCPMTLLDTIDELNRLKSITQATNSNIQKNEHGEFSSVFNFSFPIDLQFNVPLDQLYENRWPIIVFQLNSLDDWDRNRIEGYGLVEIPRFPGHHEASIRTWKPDDDNYSVIHSFFLGGSVKVKDLIQIASTFHKDNLEQRHFINRMHLSTNSSGTVHFNFNISMQTEQYQEESIDKFKDQKHQSMFTKQRETKRGASNVSKSFATTLMKTDAGYINRFINTELNN